MKEHSAIKPERRGEPWNPLRVAVMLEECKHLAPFGAFTGGWAWHFMSPPHQEVKSVHDHKDIDFFVRGDHRGMLIAFLKERGYEKAWTKYDGKSPNFVRYMKYEQLREPMDGELETVKIILDLFTEEVPNIQVTHADGDFNVVEPSVLLSFYNFDGRKHMSEHCVAVQAAKKLLEKGVSPVGHKDLVGEWAL